MKARIRLTNLVIVLHELFWHFINTTAYHLDRYDPLSPSSKELHELLQIVKTKRLCEALKWFRLT